MNILIMVIYLTLMMVWFTGVYTSLSRIAAALEKMTKDKEKNNGRS